MGIVLHFVEPLVEALEGLAVGDIEHQEGRNRPFVVGPSYRLEGLLPRLNNPSLTVSQICILMLLFWVWIILEANSTPRVGSRSSLNLASMNRESREDLPTSTSKTGYLNPQRRCT
jgi:hypothetical protein